MNTTDTPLARLEQWLRDASHAQHCPLGQEIDADGEIADTGLGSAEIRTYSPAGHALGRLLVEVVASMRTATATGGSDVR